MKKKNKIGVYEVKNLTKAERVGTMTLCEKHAKEIEHILKKGESDSMVLVKLCPSLSDCTKCKNEEFRSRANNKEIKRITVVIPSQITMVFNKFGFQIPEFQAPNLLLKDKILSALEGQNVEDIFFEIVSIRESGKEPPEASPGIKRIDFERFKAMEPEEEEK